MTFKRERERRSLYSLIYSAFESVANLPHVQNQWISIGVWLELIKLNTGGNDTIDKLNKSGLKRVLTSNTSKVSKSVKLVSESGYYYQKTSLKVNGKTQNVDAIFFTELGVLPQLVHTLNWHRLIIIELPPSWHLPLATRTQASIRSITPPPSQRRRVNL